MEPPKDVKKKLQELKAAQNLDTTVELSPPDLHYQTLNLSIRERENVPIIYLRHCSSRVFIQ